MAGPTNRQRLIASVFHDMWDDYGDDASTEFLICMTADNCRADYEEVVDALAATADDEGV